MTSDPVRKTYWVYTDQAIWEVGVSNEHRDVWKIYLEKGKYDAALQYANVSFRVDVGTLTLEAELLHAER